MITNELLYGKGIVFDAPVELIGSDNFASATDWTPSPGDVLVSLNGSAAQNITTLPTFITNANSLKWTLSDTEMESGRVSIIVVQQNTKVIKDTQFNLFTEAFNRISVIVGGTPTATSIETNLTDANGVHADSILKIIKSASLRGAQAFILDSFVTNGVLTFEDGRFPSSPAIGDEAIIINK